MADVVHSVLEPVVNLVRKHVGYVTSSAKHVNQMQREMKHLDAVSLDLKRHIERNVANCLHVPPRVFDWLKDVEFVKEDVEIISSISGCFNLKERYEVARLASHTTDMIRCLIVECSNIHWTDIPIPLGRVDSFSPSTSSSPLTISTSNAPLKHFQQENSYSVALCGMDRVGKATMIVEIKKFVKHVMAYQIVKVVIGRYPDMKAVQDAVAMYTGNTLTEKDKKSRAENLRERFNKRAESGQKTLVILDNLWNKFELQDIGLNPLPKGVKLLLTSRDDGSICRQMVPNVKVFLVDTT